MRDPVTLELVIPCFNPPDGWSERLVMRCRELGSLLPGITLRYILVDDGSKRGVPPGSHQRLLEELGEVTWLRHGDNRGKGAALRTGVVAATGEHILFTDVDLPYTTESMAAACRALIGGANVVLGHRRTDYYDRVPLARRLISKSFRWGLRHVLRFPISDTQCGLKGFDQRGREVFLATTIDRFLFDMEFVMLVSRRHDLRIEVVDAELDEGVRFSRMNMRILARESLNFIKVMIRGIKE
jgi:glycosyltransferase involved in cell wall biosynthesis